MTRHRVLAAAAIVTTVVALAAIGAGVWPAWRARRAFARELAYIQQENPDNSKLVAAALRLPRDRFLVPVLERVLEPDSREGSESNARTLAVTAIAYWDTQ